MGSLSKIYITKATSTLSTNAIILRMTQIEEQMTQELSQLKNLLVQKEDEIREVKQQYESLKSQKDEEIRKVNERYKSLESQR